MQPEAEPAPLWNAAEYPKRCAPTHRELDDWFLGRHPVRQGDDVVDLGCGPGEFTARLAQIAEPGEVTGVDVDPAMIRAAAGHQRRNLRFVRGSAEQVEAVVPAASVDLVVSRAMLHWLPSALMPRVFAGVFAILRPGGWFHAECAGTGQAPALIDLINSLAGERGLDMWPGFPDTGITFERLEQVGFAIPDEGVRTIAQRRTFTREGALGYLTAGAINALTRQIPDENDRQALIRDAAARVDELRRYDGSFDATFVPRRSTARGDGEAAFGRYRGTTRTTPGTAVSACVYGRLPAGSARTGARDSTR
jgi:SAM-dependent methyltransferase